MTPHAESDAAAATVEFKAVPEFVAMGKEGRHKRVHRKVSATCAWAVLALEMMALDKAELVKRVGAAAEAEGTDGMMDELQAAIEDAEDLIDIMKRAQARLVIARSVMVMRRRH
jgi:hypothetical protein